MGRRWIGTIFIIVGTAALTPAIPQRGSEAEDFLARKERWAVKTGADRAARSVAKGRVRQARVRDLVRLERPRELPVDATSRAAQVTRYSRVEKSIFAIDADVIRYKLEKGDSDFHIVIRDHGDVHAEDAPVESGQRRTMVVEIPDPSVVTSASPWRSAIANARQAFTEQLRPGPRFAYQVIHARITGVGFFDFLHGQSGCAPNGIELHPALSVKFLDDGGMRADTQRPAPRRSDAAAQGQAGGQVWVNLRSGVYWRPGTPYYGNTVRGKYMKEQDAIREGYRAAQEQ